MNSPSKSVMIVKTDNRDLIELFKDALELQGIETYTFTNPTFALKKIEPIQISSIL